MVAPFPFEAYLNPVSIQDLFGDLSFNKMQLGQQIAVYEERIPDLDASSIVLLGVEEFRGSETPTIESNPADAIRKQLYPMFHWHSDIRIADLGNLKKGENLKDTEAALKMVLGELMALQKTVVILGGSHDLTLTQYGAYAANQQIIEATLVDALIDLHEGEHSFARRFLMEMLTGQPNFIRHYNHIGFQSYFVHPRLLETLDKLRFDVFRLGQAREDLSEMEPIIRSTDLMSFDINAIRTGDSPAGALSPNGFTGEEACSLLRYAGMSDQLSTIGLYGYIPEKDRDNMSAIQIAQMIWYFVEGRALVRNESSLKNLSEFQEFHLSSEDFQTTFLKSKRTGRWWMRIPEGEFVPCTYSDYVVAGRGEIPERWLRIQERM